MLMSSYNNDQRLLDYPHPDPRLGRGRRATTPDDADQPAWKALGLAYAESR